MNSSGTIFNILIVTPNMCVPGQVPEGGYTDGTSAKKAEDDRRASVARDASVGSKIRGSVRTMLGDLIPDEHRDLFNFSWRHGYRLGAAEVLGRGDHYDLVVFVASNDNHTTKDSEIPPMSFVDSMMDLGVDVDVLVLESMEALINEPNCVIRVIDFGSQIFPPSFVQEIFTAQIVEPD